LNSLAGLDASPSFRINLLLKAWMEPPRPTGIGLDAMTTTSAPFSAAALAQTRPDVPAPTTTIAADILFSIRSADIGGGGVSNEYFPD
jgi:hypothetical protein